MRMLRIFSYDFIAIGVLLTIIFFIYIKNLSGDFWISGWDNLHPEFNFSINLERAIFSSWQEYQGLGLPAGHGHATEFSRELLLWFLNIFFPAIMIRKIFVISMLILGAMGVYFFTRNVLFKKIDYELKMTLSFIASSFYTLNLATVQIFYVPYEAFISHFGFLPWMIYSIYLFMYSPSKKNFLVFLLIQFFGTWQFYIPTLFFVYIFSALIFCLGIAIERNFYHSWKLGLKVLILILLVNLYWLLPFSYFTLTNLSSQREAYLNMLYSKDTYFKNAKFGQLENATLLKGYLFNFISFSNNKGFDYMMGPWISHSKQWYFLTIGYCFFVISLIGIIDLIRKKSSFYLFFLFLLYFSFIANQVYPFNIINDFFRSSSLFDQVFRNPYTKFINSVLFILTIFLSYGFFVIINKTKFFLTKFNYKKSTTRLTIIILFIYFFSLNLYILPLWKGFLIYPSLKVNIPNEYFEVFDFFKSKGNGRIANLPQFSPNGWTYYRWGYQGSGFIWYGIRQPVLDRAFDVWNKLNENYYWEISEAIYSQNLSLFEKVLDKYQINWILLDENVIAPFSPKQLYSEKIQELLKKSSKIFFIRQFGRIKLYEVNLNNNSDNFIFTKGSLPNINPKYRWSNKDQGYIDYGDYQSVNFKTTDNANIFFPFRSLFTGRKQEEREFILQEDKNYFILTSFIPEIFHDFKLVVPSLNKEEILEINLENPIKIATKEPKIFINNNLLKINNYHSENIFHVKTNGRKSKSYLKISIPKIYGYFSNATIVSSKIHEIKPHNCNSFNRGFLSIDSPDDKNSLVKLTSTNSNNCLDFNLPNLPHKLAYLLSISAKNIKGKSLFVSIINHNSKREDLATYLPETKQFSTSYFVITPKEKYGLGYTIHLDNISLNKNKTINELGEIKINPFPYEFLSTIKLIENTKNFALLKNNKPEKVSNFRILHKNPFYYDLEFDNLPLKQYLILSQSYNIGWKAYEIKCQNSNLKCQIYKFFPFLFGQELKNHVLVNNWANAWQIKTQNSNLKTQNLNIIIVFLPQYLQFLGFGFLIGSLIFILAFKD